MGIYGSKVYIGIGIFARDIVVAVLYVSATKSL
jgi:hypothetical protein